MEFNYETYSETSCHSILISWCSKKDWGCTSKNKDFVMKKINDVLGSFYQLSCIYKCINVAFKLVKIWNTTDANEMYIIIFDFIKMALSPNCLNSKNMKYSCKTYVVFVAQRCWHTIKWSLLFFLIFCYRQLGQDQEIWRRQIKIQTTREVSELTPKI